MQTASSMEIRDEKARESHQLAGSWFTDDEVYLYGEGNFLYSYRKFGAHFRTVDGVSGVHFAVWAPHAQAVSVIGPFNGWDHRAHPMYSHRKGIWELFIPNLPTQDSVRISVGTLSAGEEYKYSIQLPLLGCRIDKSDPYGFYAEEPPGTASRLWSLDGYVWGDAEWVADRPRRQALDQPLNIYEIGRASCRERV